MATLNYFIRAEDGWVKIAGACNFLRVQPVPCSADFYFYHSATTPPVNSTSATGTVTFTSTGPLDGETLTIGGQVYTFKDTPVAARDIQTGGTVTALALATAAKINANSTVVTASPNLGVVTLSAVDVGTGGNAITLTETGTNTAVSGATLSTAVDLAVGNLVTGGELFVDVAISDGIWARVTDSLPDRPVRLDVFTL